MQMLDHPNIVALKHCFFSTTDKEEIYLNLVLEYVPETVNRIARGYNRMHQRMPLIYVKLYTYQVLAIKQNHTIFLISSMVLCKSRKFLIMEPLYYYFMTLECASRNLNFQVIYVKCSKGYNGGLKVYLWYQGEWIVYSFEWMGRG